MSKRYWVTEEEMAIVRGMSLIDYESLDMVINGEVGDDDPYISVARAELARRNAAERLKAELEELGIDPTTRIDESYECFIVELAPGAYWLNTNKGRFATVGHASLATPVQPGSLAYDLKMFPRDAFPKVRLVPIAVGAYERNPNVQESSSYTGVLTHVRKWNRLLTNDEIVKFYNKGAPKLSDEEISSLEVYYFGCWQQAGHFWRAPHYMSSHDIEVRVGSNIHPRIDGGFCPGVVHPRKSQFDRRTRDEVEGEAALHYVDGWTILSYWDRSVDSRGGCNSNFVALGTHDFDTMMDVAQVKFPTVLDRIHDRFEVELVVEEHRLLPP